MTSLIKGRQFQLWEYHVSHGALLLRSPEGVGNRRIVDIIRTGAQYFAASRHVGEIEVAGATAEEIAEMEEIHGKRIRSAEQVYVLEGAREWFPLVAVSLSIQGHRGSLFKSPLCNRRKRGPR